MIDYLPYEIENITNKLGKITTYLLVEILFTT